MKRTPTIIVQLIHIQGPEPLNGKLQEFSNFPILIGRHPSCHLLFPKELAIISRHHAEIIREGNRFRLVDKSTNGIFIKTKRVVEETFLNQGDVIIFAEESGPKISFLTEIREDAGDLAVQEFSHSEAPPQQEIHKDIPKTKEVEKLLSINEVPPVTPSPPHEIPEEPVKITLDVQYGPAIKRFKNLPITMGKNPECDFVLNHPDVYEHHIRIIFSQGQYGVKDITGKDMVLINGEPVKTHAFLRADDRLSLTRNGPHFQFCEGGRLAEVEAPVIEDTADIDYPDNDFLQTGSNKEGKSFFKKLFRK